LLADWKVFRAARAFAKVIEKPWSHGTEGIVMVFQAPGGPLHPTFKDYERERQKEAP
jgi:hypothetical protein